MSIIPQIYIDSVVAMDGGRMKAEMIQRLLWPPDKRQKWGLDQMESDIDGEQWLDLVKWREVA